MTRTTRPVYRVAVVGAVAAGKSTLAREIAARIRAPYIELDALRYEAGWVLVPQETFRARAAQAIGTDRWVIEGNYSDVQDLLWVRAQLLVWLDIPLRVVLWRLMWRTVRRILTGEVFSTGKREHVGRLLGRNSIVLWAIRSHRRRRRVYEELTARDRYSHLGVVRLRSASEIAAWLSRASFGEPE